MASHLVGVWVAEVPVIGQVALVYGQEAAVQDGRLDAVQPGAFVVYPGCSEGCARQLLSIQPIGTLLRIVLRTKDTTKSTMTLI